jgi:H+/Cl- antiporter ClcA
MTQSRVGQYLHHWLEQIRMNLSRSDALLTLAILGLITGLLAGGVIVAFRLLVEGTQGSFLPGGGIENYESLPGWLRFTLPVIGGLIIGLLFRWASGGIHMLGVARVIERLTYHQGHLSLRELLLQFVGAALAIISGHSVGREGPNVHLGAASGSLLGQRLSLPNNCIRTLVGCGTAAGISASFNTPLAGVIFALEVIMMEYTLASFIPVILAAVSADALSILFFGSETLFKVPAHALSSLLEMPLILVLGFAVGLSAAAFIQLYQFMGRHGIRVDFLWRTTLAGIIVGLCSLLMPQVMGVGYDTINLAMLGELGLTLLLLLIIFKIVASAASGALGIPGGMIAPSLFIGAVTGGAVGVMADMIMPGSDISPGFYALLGMGAMMGASLQAPLAGLTAMLELTHSPAVVMPGMLAIVVAALTASELFGKESIFTTVLKASGRDYRTNPVLQTLRRIGVGSVMQQSFARHDHTISRGQAMELLADEPEWIIIDQKGEPTALIHAVDLARHLQSTEEEEGGSGEVDLMEIPAWREQVLPINLQATLQEALELLDNSPEEALYVERMTAPGIHRIYGILTREQIESAYRY